MTCREEEATILDLARHQLDAEAERRLRRHLAECVPCATRVRHEQALTAGLQALSASVSGQVSGRLEARLLDRFAQHHASRPRPRLLAQSLWWASIAAVVTVVVGGLVTWRALGTGAPRRHGQALAIPAIPAPPVSASSTAPRVPVSTRAVKSRFAPASSRRTRSRPLRRLEIVHPEGFVPLPASGALPAFESGEIVRMQIPLASLPLYGVAIPVGADAAPVQADLLVGQDGQPRAIRLVTTGVQDARSRQ